MKNLIVVFVFFIPVPFSMLFAQGHNGLYGNEWIDYSAGREYFKIKISEDGMYRVSAAVLQAAGANISSINLNGLQLYHEGQELPIHVESTSGTLDYVQFYGKKNRGAYDINVYNDTSHHFNENYSLYNDTAAYFLTWGSTASSMHFTDITANLTNLPPAEPYFMHKNTVTYSDYCNKGHKYMISTSLLYKSIFEFGEGYGSVLSDSTRTLIPSEHPFLSGPDATANVKIFKDNYAVKTLKIKSGSSIYASYNTNVPQVASFTAQLPASVVQDTGTEIISIGTDHYISNAELTYPRTFDFDGNHIFSLTLAADSIRRYLEFADFDSTNSVLNQFYLYDITNSERIQLQFNPANSTVMTDLDSLSSARELILINEGNSSSYKNITGVTSVVFEDYSSSLYTSTNYLIITHSSLKSNSTGSDPISDYLAYRQSSAGGSYICADVDVQELYDQFAYGIDNHPLAIRHFAHYIKANWTNPEYVFLVGKGRDYADVRGTASNLLVPTFGNPSSDNLLLASINSDEPEIAVGRLSAGNGDQVNDYLEKIIDVEAEKTAPQTLSDKGWTKNVLHLGGGQSSMEQNLILSFLGNMKTKIESTQFGANTESLFNTSPTSQNNYIDSLMNDGLSMITFFGNSSDSIFIPYNDPQNFNNYKKYPLLLSLGPYTGEFSTATLSTGENLLFEPQAGAGVYIAPVEISAISALNNFTQEFYQSLGNSFYNHGASKSIKEAIRVLEISNYSSTIQMVCNYMVYQGDPAFRVAATDYPDYYLDSNLISHSPVVVDIQSGTFNLEIDIHNLGKAVDSLITIRVDRTFPDLSTAPSETYQVAAPLFNSVISIPINTDTILGCSKFDIFVDSDNDVDEEPAPDAENNNDVLEYCVNIVSNVAVSKIEKALLMKAFPNPTAGRFNILLGDDYEDVQFRITDISGREVHSGTLNDNNFATVEIQQPAGVYFVRLSSSGKTGTIKIIKE